MRQDQDDVPALTHPVALKVLPGPGFLGENTGDITGVEALPGGIQEGVGVK